MIEHIKILWQNFLCNTRFEYIDIFNLFMVIEAKMIIG